MSEVMNVLGDECRGDECRTIPHYTMCKKTTLKEMTNMRYAKSGVQPSQLSVIVSLVNCNQCNAGQGV